MIERRPLLLTALGVVGCAGARARSRAAGPTAEVLVMGTIHGGHRRSDRYGLVRVREIVTRIDPDVVLAEIPPDRFETAIAEFQRDGVVQEPRVRVFPEFGGAVFPAAAELGFEIVPCAAWTSEVAAMRARLLREWKTSRPEDTRAVDDASSKMVREIAAGGGADDPEWIHTREYDEVIRRGREPYDRLFNDGLGAGGWTNINTAHWALIERAIDGRKRPGLRFLVIFGAWHKHWFLDRLRERTDLTIRDVAEFL